MSKVATRPVPLPHPDLTGADWADSYFTVLPGSGLLAIDVARQMLDHAPRWVTRLLALRNRIVGLFGLKSAELKMTGRDTVGGFPVLDQQAGRVLLGFNDRHLDFRILIVVEPAATGLQRVTLTTLVQRHNLFGRFYILVITPFHRLIVRTFLGRLGGSSVSRRP